MKRILAFSEANNIRCVSLEWTFLDAKPGSSGRRLSALLRRCADVAPLCYVHHGMSSYHSLSEHSPPGLPVRPTIQSEPLPLVSLSLLGRLPASQIPPGQAASHSITTSQANVCYITSVDRSRGQFRCCLSAFCVFLSSPLRPQIHPSFRRRDDDDDTDDSDGFSWSFCSRARI